MNPSKKNIGYALGGGAARGLFHIGCLMVLEEYGIYPDCIAGTSMGSIIGGLYASGLKAGEIKQIACSIDWKKAIRLADLTLPLSGLVQGRRVTALLRSVIEDVKFSELKYRFVCVAADLHSGEQVVLSEGPILPAIRASISIPGIFTPVFMQGRYLVDGGLINVVPVSVCRDMGADFVIGINTIPDPASGVMTVKIGTAETKKTGAAAKQDELEKPIIPDARLSYHSRTSRINDGIRRFLLYRQPHLQKLVARSSSLSFLKRVGFIQTAEPSLLDVLSLSFNIIEYNVAQENLRDADMAVFPPTQTVGIWDFHHATEAIKAGEKAMRQVLERDAVARLLLTGSA